MTTVARLSAALNAVSQRCGDDNLGGIAVFLCVCEFDGICIKDIVHRCGFSEAKVSRAVEGLRQAEGGGLVDVHRHPTDGRKRQVFLTAEGVALRRDMERIFRVSSGS